MEKIKNYVTTERIIILLLAICLTLSLVKCDGVNKDNLALRIENQQLDSMKNTQGKNIYMQDAIITADQDAINKIAQDNFNLKKKDAKNVETIAYLEERVRVKVKGIKIPYLDTLGLDEAIAHLLDSVDADCREKCKEVVDQIDQNSISVPRKAEYRSDSINLHLTLNRYYASLDSLDIPDSQYVRFATQKYGGFLGMFKKKKTIVQVLHTNPLFKTESMNSIFYVPKKKPQLLLKGLILGAGIFLGSKL